MSAPISNDKFMEIIKRMFAVGGEWKMTMSKEGAFLTYDGETHEVTLAQSEAMWAVIPRKAIAG